MICIFVGIVAALIIGNFYGVMLGVIIFLAFCLLSLFPLEGFKKPNCEETIRLIKLKRGGERTEYIERRIDKIVYAYDAREMYSLDGEAYEETYIPVRKNIKIYVSKDCETPKLKVFKRKPNRELIVIAPFSTKTEYVFYIPEGTIAEEVNLN